MADKIRVLEAIRQGMVGGGETHVYDLSTRLDPDKFEPIVLSFTEGEMVDNLRKKNIETHVINTTTPFDPSVVKSVKKLIKDLKIDIVHAHGTRAASNVLKAARQLNIPIIYTIHGWSYNDSQSKIIYKIRKVMEDYITSRTNLNICVSESNQKTGEKNIKNFKSIVINNGISLEKFNFNIDVTELKKELGMSSKDIWIGFIARMTFQKDPLTMIEGFHMAKMKQPNLKLLIVGGGELSEEVERIIQARSLERDVKILPFRSDVPALLKAIDIYCLPSLWEGLPIGILEAMAMKKPVIATKVDGTKELVNEENGLLINTKSAKTLSEAIITISRNSDAIKSLGEGGYELIKTKFTIEEMVSKTSVVYEKMMNEK